MPCSYVALRTLAYLACLPHLVFFRMTLLITVFLVLVNIFNTITTNIPKAEGLTAIEAWVIVCVLFVFGALIGEKLTTSFGRYKQAIHFRVCGNSAPNKVESLRHSKRSSKALYTHTTFG